MKNSAFLIIIIVFSAATFFILSQKNQKTNITIGNQSFNLRLANTDSERYKGLSLSNNLPKNEGMLFIFDDKKNRSFWMKNTYMPLQIIFIDDCTVVDIQEMTVEKNPANPEKLYRSKHPADKVIELNSQSVSEKIIGLKINELCRF